MSQALLRAVIPETGRCRRGTALLRSAVWLIVSFLNWTPGLVSAQTGTIDREYEIKAAYLYNFGKYIEWDQAANAPAVDASEFVVGVVGENPFGDALQIVAQQKQIHGRSIVVHEIRSVDQYRPCQILFFSADAPEVLTSQVLQQARSSASLLVGERPGFARSGGIVNMYVEQNRVKFEINVDAAERSGIKISSKLLSIGKIVEP
jgi:hypothetical protein